MNIISFCSLVKSELCQLKIHAICCISRMFSIIKYLHDTTYSQYFN